VVRNPVSRGIVYLHGGGWLGASNFFEGGLDGNSFLGVDEYGTKLCFGGGRCNDLDDLTNDVDETVEAGVIVDEGCAW